MFVLILVLGACNPFAGNPLAARLHSFMSDVNNEDIDALMANYSLNYLDDGYTYWDARQDWLTIFNTPNYSFRLYDLHVIDSFWDDVLGEGWLDGEMRYVENDNGNVTEGTLTFTEFFVLENGRWLLYGNQNPSIKDSEKKRRTWRELLRRQPHKTKPQP
jgi:hypothetical protein